ncbi:DUF5696 domain-containing protein [Lederbergia panacisoli]|uniref:DUF5696 domain-containing protein n=1 Tax=Lederbergia panacisoli TaxID=1255251 RepID=UPI00214C898C|nr:DUF5696 domain-containing protein [Lederbergia panacisoli]MCR2823856.1 DUF5696 domain-containing protein [Lederbergia panacisoli]
MFQYEKINRKNMFIFFICTMLIFSLFPQGIFAEDAESETAAEANSEEQEAGSDGETAEAAPPKEIVIVETGELYPITATKKVAENASFELYIDEANGNIRIVNKKSGKEWLGGPQVDKGILPNNKAFIDAPVHIEYTDGSSISQTYTLKDKENEVTTSTIENGIRVEFNIKEIKVNFALEYTLTDDGFEATIPDDSIKESGTVRLTSLEVLPFFHAADRKVDGEVFVPDGSGALMIVSEKHPQYFKGYSEPVYGPDPTFTMELGDVMAEGFTRGAAPKERIALPVFGIHQEQTGFLGIITNGEETANITATPSGIRNIPLYRAGAKFFYRKQDIMFIGSSGAIPLFQGQRITGDRIVKYILLEGEGSNYVGMAHAYRDYLLKEAGLQKQAEKETPLFLELVGGIMRDEIIGKTFIDMTTFKQAQSIIDDYADKGIKSLTITFKGWSKKGLYGNQPDHFPIERKLGGKKDLEELSNYAKKMGVGLNLDVNYVRPFEDSDGLTPRKDAVRGIDREVMMNPNYRVSSRLGHNGQLFYLLEPEKSSKYALQEASTYKDLGISGVHFSHVGNLLYTDLDKQNPSSREEMKETWIQTIDQFKKSVDHISVDYGFGYLLGSVNEIHQIPMDSSNFVYLDETVPFYQIVIHGLIPYTGKPSNLRDDERVEFLRAIEYGATPSFELTYKPTDHLKRTMEDRLFSSDYSYWFNRSVKEYEEIKKLKENIGGQLIANHERLAKKVYKTSYENGTEVIVNYNRKAKTVDGLTVEGENYTVIEGGKK